MRVTLATCQDRPELTSSDALLRDALRQRGVQVRVLPWDRIDRDTLEAGERVCIRSTWDYHHRHQEFARWVSGFAGKPGVLWNPPGLVLGNIDKGYLRELARSGIAIPPTEWIEPGADPRVEEVMARRGWEEAVFKPRVSATAHGTHLVRAGSAADPPFADLARGTGALLQAFIGEVRTGGEVSLMYLAGGYSHAARKLPAEADFRVQHDFGGSSAAVEPSAALRAFGERVVATIAGPWAYARVDAIETAGGPVLMELELIEPDLFFPIRPESAGRLAEVLADERSGR